MRECCGRQGQLGDGRHCGPRLVLHFSACELSAHGMADAGAIVIGHLRAAQTSFPIRLCRGLGPLLQLTLVAALYSSIAGEHRRLAGVEWVLLNISGTLGGVLLVSIPRRSRETDPRGDSRNSI